MIFSGYYSPLRCLSYGPYTPIRSIKIMSEWLHFNACIQRSINNCHRQQQLIGEMYDQVSKQDPHNTLRQNNILELEEFAVAELTRLMTLMIKYKDQTRMQ